MGDKMKNAIMKEKTNHIMNVLATLFIIIISCLTVWDYFITDQVIKILLTNSTIYARSWNFIRQLTMIVVGILWLIMTLVMINRMYKSSNYVELLKRAFFYSFIGMIVLASYNLIKYIAFIDLDVVSIYEVILEFIASGVLLIGFIALKTKAKELYIATRTKPIE